ncbi:MAG: 2-C-methyl-D-erythritol 4-phosphate cytidylyltransferase [Thermoanaerobaculales bacterium]|nr:2-C-methyl-D-erythritol 4-phosphate cytidylyltransferase [Thermoanaerobaculales bacterium]
MNLAIICVAGGMGQRFGRDKLAEPLGDSTVLETSLTALRSAYPTADLCVVLPPQQLSRWRLSLEGTFPGIRLVGGGSRRQDSVRNGIESAVETGADIAAVHDGARPMVDPLDVRSVVEGLGNADGAVLCQAVVDTVKRVASDGLILETVPRDELRLAQTPQVFRVSSIQRAWAEGDFGQEWTDEAALLESLGMQVQTVSARHANPKVTTELDLQFLRVMCEERQ